MNEKTKRIARFGLLTATALILGWLEHLLPIAPGIPGIKLGLANTVLLYALHLMDTKSAAVLMLLKVLLSGFLFAGLSGLLYSLAGGAASLLCMLGARRIPGMGILGVSALGAIGHNLGQIGVACFAVGSRAALGYLPVLLLSGALMGLLTGIAARLVFRALKGKGGRS